MIICSSLKGRIYSWLKLMFFYFNGYSHLFICYIRWINKNVVASYDGEISVCVIHKKILCPTSSLCGLMLFGFQD